MLFLEKNPTKRHKKQSYALTLINSSYIPPNNKSFHFKFIIVEPLNYLLFILKYMKIKFKIMEKSI